MNQQQIIRTHGMDIIITAQYPVTDDDAKRIFRAMKEAWDNGNRRDVNMTPTKLNLRRELLKLGKARLTKKENT